MPMETAPRDLLRHLRDLGLELVLDGESLRVRGLAALDATLREQTAGMIRQRKPDIMRALDLEASLARQLAARQPATTDRELWPLHVTYPDLDDLPACMDAHGIEVEPDGDDFRLVRTPPLSRVAQLFLFFRRNGHHINRLLRREVRA